MVTIDMAPATCDPPNRGVDPVLLLARRIAATALIVFLAAGGFGVCAGWAATPEARMACCADGGACPMHTSPDRGASATGVVSQAEADSCCAASERDDSTPSTSGFVPLVSLGPVVSPVPVVVPETNALFDAWRAPVPLSGSHVPTHLLLSVFLI